MLTPAASDIDLNANHSLLPYARLVPIRALSIATYVVEDIVCRIMICLRNSGLHLPVHDFWRPKKTSTRDINNLEAYLGNTTSTVITYVTILCSTMPLAWVFICPQFMRWRFEGLTVQTAVNPRTSTPRGLTRLIELIISDSLSSVSPVCPPS